jgi:hypothetical protein
VWEVPVLENSDRRYLKNLLLLAFILRSALLYGFELTNAVYNLRLSPDSEKYHSVGIFIMKEMDRGFYNWPNWIDNGWFQFTGFVYHLFGPHPIIIQL